MEKRLPLALFLSFLILFGWSLLQKPPVDPGRPVDGGRGEAATGAAPGAPGIPPPAPQAPPEPIGSVVRAAEERELTVRVGEPGRPGSFLAVFSNRGGVLRELRLGDWYDVIGLDGPARLDPEHWNVVLRSMETGERRTGSLALRTSSSSRDLELAGEPLHEALWEMRLLGTEDAPTGVEFEYAPGTGVRFAKRVLFQPGSYELALQLEVANEAVDRSRGLEFRLTPAEVVPRAIGDNFYREPQAIAAGRSKEAGALQVESEAPHERGPGDARPFDVDASPLAFAGVHNKYFAVVLRPADEGGSRQSLRGAQWRPVHDVEWARENPEDAEKAWRGMATDVLVGFELPARGQSVVLDYRVYAGPKQDAALVAAHPDLEYVTRQDLRSFIPGVTSIAKLLLWVLGGLHALTGNWGLAIILLTLCVRVVLFPINRRSQTAMARYQKKMKRLQPQIDELKKRHQKDPQKLRQEQAQLMQREGAFPPLGGCLPIFLQLPVFFGLFTALRTSFELRHSPFVLWIRDLSLPDRLLRLDFDTHLPFIGTIEYLNVLPPAMVVLWVLQQRLMPTPADEQAARMQRMMMWMPVLMGVFLYNYAAGLSLYMITQSGLGILEMSFIKKRWPIDDTELPRKERKPGFLTRLAEKQMEQQRRLQAQAAQKQRSKVAKGGGRKR